MFHLNSRVFRLLPSRCDVCATVWSIIESREGLRSFYLSCETKFSYVNKHYRALQQPQKVRRRLFYSKLRGRGRKERKLSEFEIFDYLFNFTTLPDPRSRRKGGGSAAQHIPPHLISSLGQPTAAAPQSPEKRQFSIYVNLNKNFY
jgi:hypothetical protein